MFQDLIGVPYKSHGRSKNDGFDCYGLVIECAKRAGKHLNDAFDDKSAERLNVERIESPELYCIVSAWTLGRVNHIGMYIGHQQVIHCSVSGVCVQKLGDFNVEGFYRITED